ncbi:MAG: phospho-N-acetylmuramoyl-pentapeptide-transferase [Oscillospiraceae bacterium]|nr:phospho-N-acetylmuramoyl-pentapeptide-transferase [Oscillospiraceae bacterium]
MNAIIIIVTAITAFAVTALSGFALVPFLRKVKFGQTIKDIGPTWHKHKQGIPTMGGLMFIAGTIAAVFAGYLTFTAVRPEGAWSMTENDTARLVAGVGLSLMFAFVGFMDDYISVVKKRNLGLKARHKTVMQILIAIVYMFIMYHTDSGDTLVDIPFAGQWDLGILYYPMMVIAIYFLVNAVNITDGIDGLAGSVTFAAAVSFMIISAILQYSGAGIFATALAGGCLGFLAWNFYPAKVIMGDVGSMFLGGAVVALGFICRRPVILALVGVIYIIEAMSVVLQVISFKTTGKRIFKMSPIHHHYEMKGWSETKIVLTFSAIAVIFGGIAVLSVVFAVS